MCVGRRDPRRGARRSELSGDDIMTVAEDRRDVSSQLDENLDNQYRAW